MDPKPWSKVTNKKEIPDYAESRSRKDFESQGSTEKGPTRQHRSLCLTAKESSSPLLVYHLPHPESLLGSHHTAQHRNNRLSRIVKLYSTLNHSKHRYIKC